MIKHAIPCDLFKTNYEHMKNVITYKGFVGTVDFSSEDHLFYGKIIGIDDLVTFEGSSVAELESSFKYMVDMHIEDCQSEGKPIEKSYKGIFNIRVGPELHKKAAHTAKMKGITLNQLIKRALQKELEDID
jgi:predicted HicB family RNase H-like nuclease